MEIQAIGIIGANEVGAGLAELLVKNGFQVRMYDHFKDSIGVALAKIKWSLHQCGKDELFSNIEGTQELEKLQGADMLIEAMEKDMEERKFYFAKLKEVMGANCLIAAACSIHPLEELIEATELPRERTIGLHFIKPVRSNSLVELVRIGGNKDEFADAAMAMLKKIGKTPVMVKDNPGQIVERLTRPLILSAMKLLEAGKGFPHEIDAAFKDMAQAPFGPFELVDFIGLERDYKASQEIYEDLGKPGRLMPSATEMRLVQYGQLGRKSTIGFYIYEDGAIVGENPILSNVVKYLGLKKVSKEEVFVDIMRPVVEEARLLAAEIMASEYDMETAMKLAMGWPKGPFAYARDMEHLFVRKPVSEFDKLDAF